MKSGQKMSHIFKSLEIMKFSSSIVTPRTQAFSISLLYHHWHASPLSSDLSPHGLKPIAADPVITSPHSHVQRQETEIDLFALKRKTYPSIQTANFPLGLIHQSCINYSLAKK